MKLRSHVGPVETTTSLSIPAGLVRLMRTMKLSFAAALALLLVPLPAFALQPLEVFLAAAPRNSVDALESRANVEQQRAQADLAFGRVLPGLSARGSLTRNQYDSIIDLGPPAGQVTVVPLTQFDGAVTLTVPLIDAAGFQRVAAARTSTRAADGQLASIKLQIEAAVAQDYYQLVANLALATASQKALEVSRESLRLAKNRHDAGVAPELDLDRARADLEQQNQQVSAAGLQVALATRALETASGVAPEAATAEPLDDDLHPEGPLASAEASLEQLPSVAAAMELTRAAGEQADAQRLTWLPTLAGTLAERGTSSPGFTGHNFSWQAVLALSWAVDLTTPANIHAQDAAFSAARAREQRARLFARDGIHRQWETVNASIARSRSARSGRAAADRAASSARDRYQAGTITQLELLQAQRDAFSAEVSRIQADADLVNARAQLRLATGTSLLVSKGTVP